MWTKWTAWTIAVFWALAFGHSPHAAAPHIVFLISEDPHNYEAHTTIPPFAEALEREEGYRVTVLMREGEGPAYHFSGLEALAEADLLVVFCRRTALPLEQMEMIKGYLAKGHPLVGIRTANHAFSVREDADGGIPEGHAAWWEFVPEILGCENRGYGPVEPGTAVATVAENEGHPILEGVEPLAWHSIGNLYRVAPLMDEAALVLLTGTVEGDTEPIAWTRETKEGSRVFYTSLGHPADFEAPPFRTLLRNGIRWALIR